MLLVWNDSGCLGVWLVGGKCAGSESVVWGLSIPGGAFCVVWEHLWMQGRLVLWEAVVSIN